MCSRVSSACAPQARLHASAPQARLHASALALRLQTRERALPPAQQAHPRLITTKR